MVVSNVFDGYFNAKESMVSLKIWVFSIKLVYRTLFDDLEVIAFFRI